MSELAGLLMFVLLLGWLGRFVVSEVRAGGVLVRAFWLSTALVSLGFLGLFLYAAGQPNW